MQIFDVANRIHELTKTWRTQQQKIAFVPTMGNLHAGHLSLIEYAGQHADKVVVSIFVNPTQFNEQSDFATYPRTLDEDISKLSALRVDALFTPGVDQVYPHGVENAPHIELTGPGKQMLGILEGEQRPGHFQGVATVVKILFDIVQPHLAVFGEKDFQQLLIIKLMARQLGLPVEIIGRATVREANGLAMSSRNQHLSTTQREQAAHLYAQLSGVAQALRQHPDLDQAAIADLEQQALKTLKNNGFKPEYFTVRDVKTLASRGMANQPRIVLAAARIGATRLIDNIRV